MNLIPDFKIGLWNAWIPIVPFILMNYVIMIQAKMDKVPKLEFALRV